MESLPAIGVTKGEAFTVMILIAVLLQSVPDVTVYVMVSFPAATPVTKPVTSTVAILVLVLPQTPPVVELLNCVGLKAQILVLPEIELTAGLVLTFTIRVATTEQLPCVTV